MIVSHETARERTLIDEGYVLIGEYDRMKTSTYEVINRRRREGYNVVVVHKGDSVSTVWERRRGVHATPATPLGERLARLRGQRTQLEAATELGLRRSTYAYYELGRREPPLSVLCVLARYYHTTTDYLLGIKETP